MGLFNGLKRAYAKHGSAWLAIAAVGGVIVEGVLAYRAGKRCGQHPEWTEKEKIMNCAGAAGAGVATVGAIAVGHRKDAGEIATLMSTQLLNEKNRQKWVKSATDIIGEENMKKIKQSMHPVNDIPVKTTDGTVLVIDDLTGAKWYMNELDLWKGIDRAHEIYHSRGYISHGEMIRTCGCPITFDGKRNPIPLSEDSEGNCLTGLSDDQIGYSTSKMWTDGYDSDWFSIYPVSCINDRGEEYFILETTMYPVANYKEY